MRRMIFAIGLVVLAAGGCQTASNAYRVNYIPDASVTIDGQLDEKAWEFAEPLGRFADPWRDGCRATRFAAFRDDQNLYFAFVAQDNTPRLAGTWQGENTLDNEDRVEIYFALDDKLAKYYCIEIDSAGRVHDFTGSFPRKWDSAWNMPGLKTAGNVVPDGYVVEGRIPLSTLEDLGLPRLQADRNWRVGLFRPDLDRQGGKSVYWITWIDPKTPKPDFHAPGAFGIFQCGQKRLCAPAMSLASPPPPATTGP